MPCPHSRIGTPEQCSQCRTDCPPVRKVDLDATGVYVDGEKQPEPATVWGDYARRVQRRKK